MLDSAISKLPAYLKAVKDVPFKWGEHDCLIFTNNAWKAMHGHGWADDWLGRYMDGTRPLSRKELQEEYGYKTFVAAVDARLTRVNHIPPRGALVTTRKARRWAIGNALGICIGTKAAFVSKTGLTYHPIENIDKAWIGS
jgi:hypothetical protein